MEATSLARTEMMTRAMSIEGQLMDFHRTIAQEISKVRSNGDDLPSLHRLISVIGTTTLPIVTNDERTDARTSSPAETFECVTSLPTDFDQYRS
jgi:hypothetical protein